MRRVALILAMLLMVGCREEQTIKEYVDYVNTFIGTDAHGHTYPGAALPFGMVQLSPDTGTEGWDLCSGYHSSDSTIMGFSHTHLSGTGGADLGDILFMPANGNLLLRPGSADVPDDGYRSRFSHASERSEPGYYTVMLDDYQTIAEMTVTPRTGLHRYTFERDEPQHIVIDLNHGIADLTKEGYYRVVDSVTIEGYRRSQGWAEDHTVYFCARFSHPFDGVEGQVEGMPTTDGEVRGTVVALAALYDEAIKELEIQVGISSASQSGARANLEAECTTFSEARLAARQRWNSALSRIKVEGDSDDDKVIFYTSLYHTMLAPTIISDADGGYASADGFAYRDSTLTAYGLFSLWDTFRALHPLFTIIEPERNAEFIRSMIRYYDQTGRLPVWDLNMNETNCMIGYHAIPVIADAYMKGLRDFDADKALEAMVASAMQPEWGGLAYYRANGYLPSDKQENSVSKALEYAYDDWCIARMAQQMGRDSIYRIFNERAQYYKNHFDPTDRFFKGRNAAGELNPDFDPTALSLWGSGDFTEGNGWQYNFFVPQDINTLIEMNGGDEQFVKRLDEMFTTEGVKGNVSDVTGLIGQYAHGNEPSHHVAYLYSYAGQPWKTAQRLDQIYNLYTSSRDGICGNEDCGQMSAWYVLSAMGFYQVTPGSNIYVLGTPRFDRVTIEPEQGEKFVVEVENLSPENIYIDEVLYNGQPYDRSYITHEMIRNGGTLCLTMSSEANREFGLKADDRPVSRITDGVVSSAQMLSEVVFEPELSEPKRVFNGSITLHPKAHHAIHYTVDGTAPTAHSTLMSNDKGIVLNEGATLQMVAVDDDNRLSTVRKEKFYKSNMPPGTTISGTAPMQPYTAAGLPSLTDGLLGGDSYKSQAWLGYEGVNPEFVVELPSKMNVGKVLLSFLNKTNDWILPPKSIEIRTAQSAEPVRVRTAKRGYEPDGAQIVSIPVNANTDRLYIKLEGGVLPLWHVNGGSKQWIFIDEIILN